MFLGIDVGTTSLKAGLFDSGGALLESFAAGYPTVRGPNGLVEQDPADWMRLIDQAIAQFQGGFDLSGLGGIGITSQVNTHVFVDENLRVLAPAIVWQDGRAAPQAAALDARIADADKLRWWGVPMPVDASHCLARMQWMHETRPDIWARTRQVLLPKDYCIAVLTGQRISDPISNIGMVDGGLALIPELLDLVPDAAGKLPPLAAMSDLAGVVRPGHPCAGVPVAVGTMDAWASMFGVGIQRPGQAFYLSGTSEVLGVVSDHVHPVPGVLVFPKVGELTLHAGPTQSGGASVRWFCELFDTTPEQMAADVAARDPSRPCPLFLPHLQGERAPLWDANARGVLLGMDASTGRADIAQAVFEGVGYSARLLSDTLARSSGGAIEGFNCGGGGFRSDSWNQIRADILGVELRRCAVADPGVLGAAGLAVVASGGFASLNDALSQFVSFDRTYTPNPRAQARYAAGFQQYVDTYHATKDISHQLAKR